jgi:hypothetical protein
MSIINSTQSRLLRISNIHSIKPMDSSSDFTVNLNRMTETDSIVRCVLKSVCFQNTQYNITSKNNEFFYTVDAVNKSVVITPGYYSELEVIAIIQPIIEAELVAVVPGITLTMIIGAYSKKIEYTLSLGGVSLILNPLSLTSQETSLNANLGNMTAASVALSYISEFVPNLVGLSAIFVHSTTIAPGNLVDGDVEQHDIIGEVPVNDYFGEIIHWESNEAEINSINYDSVRNFDQIRIQLKDIYQNTIDLHGGTSVINLKLYYL